MRWVQRRRRWSCKALRAVAGCVGGGGLLQHGIICSKMCRTAAGRQMQHKQMDPQMHGCLHTHLMPSPTGLSVSTTPLRDSRGAALATKWSHSSAGHRDMPEW